MSDELNRLRDAIAWPETPDVSTTVLARLATEPEVPPARLPRRAPLRLRLGPIAPRLAWVLCALAVVLTGTVAAIPDARSAVLEFLGLKSAKIERREPRPGLGGGLDIGRKMSLEQARRTVSFKVLVPDLPRRRGVRRPRPAGRAARSTSSPPVRCS